MIDPLNSTHEKLFYEVGARLRAHYNAPYHRFWKDSQNIAAIAAHPDYEAAFFVIDDAFKSGRAGVYKHKDQDYACAGWYECCNKLRISKSLLYWVKKWAINIGVREVIGPINGSTWNNYRFNLTANHPVHVSEPFQPLYYIDQWEDMGFEKAEIYRSNHSAFPQLELKSVEEVTKILAENDLKLQRLTNSLLQQLGERMYDFLAMTFASNMHYTPVSFPEYQYLFSGMDVALDEDHSFIITTREDDPIALVSCLNDLLRRSYEEMSESNTLYSGRKLLIKTIATHPDWQNRQLGTLAMNAVLSEAKKNGLDNALHILMYEDNISAKAGEKKFQTNPGMEYALFKSKLYG